jgi:hypothetical protein
MHDVPAHEPNTNEEIKTFLPSLKPEQPILEIA